ncbi:MAG: MFS transporter [Chromatiales bacterium]|jgi:MFS family permease
MTPFYRNVPLLSVAQSLMMSANSLIIASAALVGASLAEDKSLATLPLAAQFIAIMLTSIPASLVMDRVGRKPAFILVTGVGMSAGALAAWAIITHSFWLFVTATVLVGIFNGFGNYYRFAAADAVAAPLKSRAISWVMVGGVIAAIVGPNLANQTKALIDGAPFAGSYAALIVIYLLSLLTVSALHLPHRFNNAREHDTALQRPLSEIARQPKFVVAILCAMLGYAVMSLVMTATPLAMHHHHHQFDDTVFVIQWHVLAMFAPSFVTGELIRRFGVNLIMGIGALLGLLCVILNLAGTTLSHFWLALVALGVSWNFLFIGGTTLLTETYEQAERAKVQAANDFFVFTSVALASLSAGYLQHRLGWQAVNWGVVPLLLLILGSLGWLAVASRSVRQRAQA